MMKKLEFEVQIEKEVVGKPQRQVVVMAKGFGVTKTVAQILDQYRIIQEVGASPFLVFLVNFNDQQFKAVEYYSRKMIDYDCTLDSEEPCGLQFHNITSDGGPSHKRMGMFPKGGVFLINYKILILDILGKRFDPNLITALIINQGSSNFQDEQFLAKTIKEDNPSCTITWITENPEELMIEKLNSSIDFHQINLYPRIRQSVKNSLNDQKYFRVIEQKVQKSHMINEISQIINKLIEICIEELKMQLSVVNLCKLKYQLVPETVLSRTFLKQIKRSLTLSKITELGPKSKCLIKNLVELSELSHALLSFDSVTFWHFFSCLLYNDQGDNHFKKQVIKQLERLFPIDSSIQQFSIFKHPCHPLTIELVEKVKKLARDRIFSFCRPIDGIFSIGVGEQQNFSKAKKQHQEPKEPTMKNEYSKLQHRFKHFWRSFKDKATNGGQNMDIKQMTKEVPVYMNFDMVPKAETLIEIVRGMEENFKMSDEYEKYDQYSIRRLHEPHKKKRPGFFSNQTKGAKCLESINEKEHSRIDQNQNVLIAVKSFRLKTDLQRLLISYFVKSDIKCKSFMEDKLRIFLTSKYENRSREYKTTYYQDLAGVTTDVCQAYLTHKLSLLLDQKKDFAFSKLTMKSGLGFRKRVKPEGCFEKDGNGNVGGGPPQWYKLDVGEVKESILTEDLIQEIEEDEYKPCNIIDGYNILCESYSDTTEFEVALREIKPTKVILFEPILEFIRSLEVYNAERCLNIQNPEEMEVHLLTYKDSNEEIEFVENLQREKRSFNKLIDYQSEYKQISQNHNEIMEDNQKEIIAVDSREFSCLTPLYLRDQGFWIVPIQLYVGDYVLSDDICAERKSINTGDLFESLKSGRLLTQLTNMQRFYKISVLLIEFDESIPFQLEDTSHANEFISGGEFSILSVQSKLTMLTLTFPGLQILWSTGPAHTAALFKQIKQTYKSEPPDLQRIARIGKVATSDEYEDECNEEDEDFKRFLPTEFLKRLKGITKDNIQEVIKRCRNIIEIMAMSEEELAKIIGQSNAKKLIQFIDPQPNEGIEAIQDC